ncbi:uncharacterized protein SAPINGB_P000618 [Magnusiomyces paraingens]|uniref:Rad21/Rec8-like protein N-terminal domain-containing protein n=1 Tax=Magnusiomyces paraingens TaxID=2606893 RepID=A0A5E8B0X4_9ASCO|nr:uncharacterized protein SAPINGB_P000618 [Saprochaete ingens]VVT45042.1 unnamed protein product [Saprochaete ingens]
MFFSPEILTNRSSGLSTIWLMATLGNKPSAASAKLSRKDILATEISGVCRIIINPDGPLALRLSSNLLYGVSLVYQQQISYLLTDVSQMRSKITMENIFNLITLDPKMAKAKKSSLVLRNDLNTFNIDHVLLPMDPFPAFLAPHGEEDDNDITLHSINRLPNVLGQDMDEDPDLRAVHTNLLLNEEDEALAIDLGFEFGEDGELQFYDNNTGRPSSFNSSQSTLNGNETRRLLDAINDQDEIVDGAEFMAQARVNRPSDLYNQEEEQDYRNDDYDGCGGGGGEDPNPPANLEDEEQIDYNNLPDLNDMFPPLQQVPNPTTRNPEGEEESTAFTETQNARLDEHIESIINAHNNSSSLSERAAAVAAATTTQPPAPARTGPVLRKCPYDEEIGLSSDILREFRENYVTNMTALNSAKRRRLETKQNRLITVQSVLQKSMGLHPFGRFLATFPLENVSLSPPLETGRSAVAGPLVPASRQPSLDIEIGRGPDSTPRNFSLGLSPQPIRIGSDSSSNPHHHHHHRSLSNGPFDIPSPIIPRQTSQRPGINVNNLDDIEEDEADGSEIMRMAYQRLKDQREGRAPQLPTPHLDQNENRDAYLNWDYEDQQQPYNDNYDAHDNSVIHHNVGRNNNLDFDLELDLNGDLGLDVVLDNFYESSSGEDNSSVDGEREGGHNTIQFGGDRQGIFGAPIKKNRYNNERHFFNYTRRMASKITNHQPLSSSSSKFRQRLRVGSHSQSPSPSVLETSDSSGESLEEGGSRNLAVLNRNHIVGSKDPVPFDVLFPVGTTSRREAAGAFMMVLKLVTNGRMRVRQQQGGSTNIGRGGDGRGSFETSRSGIWLFI